MGNISVNIVVATYNRLESTKLSLPNIIETASDNIPYMISIVDNGSKDGSPEYLQQLFNEKKIHNLLLLPENIGVSKAHNIMWKLYNDIDYYAKIDNDMIFKKKNWMNEIIHVLENAPELGAFGYTCENNLSHPIFNNGKVSYRRTIGNLGGACYFVPKDIHKKLGFWCEKYALYGEEDADYSTRVSVSGFVNGCMLDTHVMESLPEWWKDYVDFKQEKKKINLSGIWQRNVNEYYHYRELYQNSNQLEKYKNIIQTNIGK